MVSADPEFYARVRARGGPDTVDFPDYFPERRITLHRNTALIGRRNRNQGVDPRSIWASIPSTAGCPHNTPCCGCTIPA